MATKTRAQLKNYFQTGAVPSQENFADLIDSFTTTDEAATATNMFRTLFGIASEIPEVINREDDILFYTDSGEFVSRVGDAVPRASFNCVITDADLSGQEGVQLLNSASSPIKVYKCTAAPTFNGNTEVTEITLIGFPNMGNFSNLCKDASRLVKADLRGMKTSANSFFNAAFQNCISLKEVKMPDPIGFGYASGIFMLCKSIVRLPRLNTPLLTNANSFVNQCEQLTEIPFLDFSAATGVANAFFGCSALVYVNIVGLGTKSALTAVSFAHSSKLGSTAAAKAALIDTLLTNSFDRATAGYDPMTVTLHADAKARLTTDEIAAITAKGFTIA